MPVDSDLYEKLKAQVEAVSAALRKGLEDGRLGFREIVHVLREAARVGVVLAEGLNVPGPEKKAIVIDLALAFWNDKLEPLDIPIVPDAVFDPVIERLIPVVIGWCVDQLVGEFNEQYGHAWPLEALLA